MDALAELLGQPDAAADLVRQMSERSARIWLRGASGSGKTTIAKAAAGELERKGRVLWIAGDAGHAGTKFFAAHRALAGTRLRKPVRDALQAGVTAPLKAIPFVGGAAADLAKIATASMGDAKPEFLSAEQQDILQGLQNYASRQRLFIIVDDVGWLDVDTAHLLRWISRPEIAKAFPFAADASILFVETSDVSAFLPKDVLSTLRPSVVVDQTSVSDRQFGDVLRALGLQRDLDPALEAELFAISRGHLEIAQQIVKLDQGTDLASLLASGDAGELMSELLSSRLQKLDGNQAVRHLLSLAACVGTAFTESEVRCAFLDGDLFGAALQAACRENLLISQGETVRFVHEVVRAAAERLATPQASDLHGRLAACVRKLRPGDYSARLRHMRLSDNRLAAEVMAFAVAAQASRGERSRSAADDELGSLQPILEDIRRAYRLMDAGEHRQVLNLMTRHYTGEDNLVQGEVVALLALNHLKRRTVDAYNEAASLLELWRERRDELELWQRLMSILLTAWAFAGEAERASQLYGVLARDLAEAARSDPMARSRAEALNRKSDMFFMSEIATKHISRAASWFGPGEGTEIPRHSFEYTACLVNLSGTKFTTGQFAEAAEHAASALRHSAELREVGLRTVEPYKSLNNFVIAAFRAGLEPAANLGKALDHFMAGSEQAHLRDRSLMACNRGVLALFEDRLDLGLSTLEAVWKHVCDTDLDGYYRLYAGSNVAVALALTDQRQEALRILNAIEPDIEAVPKWVRVAHRRRHQITRDAVADETISGLAAFDARPMIVRPPDGEHDPWRSIGFGFLLSDIQAWSEG